MDLIPLDPDWSPPVRAAQVLFGVCGVFLTTVMTLFLLIEISTSPVLPRAVVAWWSIATAVEAGHLYRLARSSTPPSAVSWAVFAAALGLMAYNAWHVIQDPTARAIFPVVLAVGGLWLGATRAMSSGLGDWASLHPARGAALVVVALLPLEAPFVAALLR